MFNVYQYDQIRSKQRQEQKDMFKDSLVNQNFKDPRFNYKSLTMREIEKQNYVVNPGKPGAQGETHKLSISCRQN